MFQIKFDDLLIAEEERLKKGGLVCSEKQLKRQNLITHSLKQQSVCEMFFFFLSTEHMHCDCSKQHI